MEQTFAVFVEKSGRASGASRTMLNPYVHALFGLTTLNPYVHALFGLLIPSYVEVEIKTLNLQNHPFLFSFFCRCHFHLSFNPASAKL